MGKKKKRRRSAGSAISPIDKRGIKLGTLFTEIGLGSQVALSYNHYGKNGDWAGFATSMTDVLKPTTPQGSIFWGGIIMKIVGKFVPQTRYMGPVGFR